MKMVKSLLLGSAAGMVAVAGAQAADLPVKAKPVEYVKICSLYGAGFYYMPGTNICIKVGGFVRAEWQVNTAGGSFSQYNHVNFDSRATNDSHVRTRGGISIDAREQTAYGTLRAYVNMAPTVTDAAPGTGTSIWHNRAFIQFAGFTAGNAVSFFDFDPIAIYSNQTNRIGSSTGGTGIPLFAYTAQFGNGFSASISAEAHQQRNSAIFRGPTAGPGNNFTGGLQWPAFVANLRVDQAWGSAQVMAAAHQLHALYYNGTAPSNAVPGSPSDEVGWAVGAGLKLNLPTGKGDFFIAQAAYTEGAITYVCSGCGGIAGGNPILQFNIQNGTGLVGDPVTVAYGPVYDATYSAVPGSSLNLTHAWSLTAALQHNWGPGWKSSLYGAYMAFNYNAASDVLLRINPGGQGGLPAPGAPANPGSADWEYYQIGSRTVWSPVPGLDLSVEAMYNRVNTAYANSPNYQDKDWVSGIFRVQRNFHP